LEYIQRGTLKIITLQELVLIFSWAQSSLSCKSDKFIYILDTTFSLNTPSASRKTEKYLQNILNKNYNFHYNMDRTLSFDYESNKIIRIWGYEKEVDQLSTSFLPIFDKFFSTLRKL